MSTFNLNKPVLVNTADHLDATFEVADNTERDTLISNKKVSQGHILYHKGENKHYILKTYNGDGNPTNAIWEVLGSGTGTGTGGSFDKELFFIDSTITDSSNSEVGNIEKPFKFLKDIFPYLQDNNLEKNNVHFCSEIGPRILEFLLGLNETNPIRPERSSPRSDNLKKRQNKNAKHFPVKRFPGSHDHSFQGERDYRF